MAFTYNPAEFPLYEITIFDDKGKEKTYTVPMLGYVPKEVHEKVDEQITEKFLAVQKLRKERTEAGIAMPDSDREVQYPTTLDMMDRFLEALAPEVAKKVALWPIKPREDLWLQWEAESKPSDPEKSDASSDSSDATE